MPTAKGPSSVLYATSLSAQSTDCYDAYDFFLEFRYFRSHILKIFFILLYAHIYWCGFFVLYFGGFFMCVYVGRLAGD